MERFTRLTAVAAPLIRDNIDTDAIIPSREMRSVGKTGLADGLFAGWRYTTIGGRTPDPAFILNAPDYACARILLTGANFGCGSSREHAAWALAEYGFRAIVAPSFNSIFQGNCVRNGIVPVVLPVDAIADLSAAILPEPQTALLTIDLPDQRVTSPYGASYEFPIGDEAKAMLIGGLDAIDLTLQSRHAINQFITVDQVERAWAYASVEQAS